MARPREIPYKKPHKRPSDDWTGYAGIDEGANTAEKIRAVLSNCDLEYLESKALQVRRQHDPHLSRNVRCNILRDKFTSGWNNMFLEVSFTDGIFWIARICLTSHSDSDDDIKLSFGSEVTTMKYLRQHTTIPVPEIYYSDTQVTPKFRHPYMFVEYMAGKVFNKAFANAVAEKHLPKIAEQIAGIYMEMQKCRFDQIGRLQSSLNTKEKSGLIPLNRHASTISISLEYFHAERQYNSAKALEEHYEDKDYLTTTWILNLATSYFLMDEKVHGPYVLCHPDLYHKNILFDEDFNITGVVDWTNAYAGPLECLSLTSEFSSHPDNNYTPLTAKLRNMVAQSLRDKANAQDDTKSDLTRLAEFMGSKRYQVAFWAIRGEPKLCMEMASMAISNIYDDFVCWDAAVRACEASGYMDEARNRITGA